MLYGQLAVTVNVTTVRFVLNGVGVIDKRISSRSHLPLLTPVSLKRLVFYTLSSTLLLLMGTCPNGRSCYESISRPVFVKTATAFIHQAAELISGAIYIIACFLVPLFLTLPQ